MMFANPVLDCVQALLKSIWYVRFGHRVSHKCPFFMFAKDAAAVRVLAAGAAVAQCACAQEYRAHAKP